ncbi:MAG: heavy metal sensor histidine kinase [Nitrospiraceae bacterium]
MPLRVKLTLWYGTALGLILMLFATALYAIVGRDLNDQIDQSLQDTARTAIRSLEQHGFGPFIQFDDLSAHFPELAVLDKFFQIFSPTGRITIQSPNIKSQDVPLSPQALKLAFEGATTYESVKVPGETLRLISVPILYQGNLLNVVQVGTSLKPVEHTLRRLFAVLLVSIPVALLVALAGGWFLAGRVLRPVSLMTDAAKKIAAGDLSQRLTVKASGDEIGELADTFNNMIARLDASFRQIRQFSSDASHELRTPLTVMKGETELVLRRQRDCDDYRSVLDSNLEEIDRMTRIVDELLFLSRADMGEVKMATAPVALTDLLADIQEQASVLGHAQDITVQVGTMQSATVLGDELRLRELFLNLVDNAVKYSKPGGTVTLTMHTERGLVRVAITDQGIGIRPDAIPRIFNRFYRTDEARGHTKAGTGLGLAICAWIADAHRGKIDVQSTVGEGSTFTVTLPLAPIPA